jgi:hypothetical protein
MTYWPVCKPDERLVCENCRRQLASKPGWGEADDQDFPWCDNCLDFVTGVVVAVSSGKALLTSGKRVRRGPKALLRHAPEKAQKPTP